MPLLRHPLPAHLSSKDDKLLYVSGRNGPANENRLCVKGRFGFDYVSHPHRLTRPLVRRTACPSTPTT